MAARNATKTIPIVFAIGADPVELGLVESLSRPGGNATGVTSLNTELAAKRLGLFRELVPKATRFLAMVNPTSQLTGPYIKDLKNGAATVGIHVDILQASTDAEIETLFATIAKEPGSALLSASDSFFYIRRPQIIGLAARYAIPMAFDTHEYVEDGGLMSYGSDFSDVLETAGRYTGRILKGETPADLPVAQSNKYELGINLKTAKALGLTVPSRVLALADDVVE
jgi:putative ABC transport system substrate-binding protein